MENEELKPTEKKLSVLQTYLSRIKAFSPNARRYLLGQAINGIASGIFQLLFNFFVLSLGYNEAILGNMVAVRSMTSLIVAVPAGFLTNKIGHRNSIILSMLTYSLSVALMLLFPTSFILFAMNIVQGVSQSLSGVAMGPFLMENSQETERTYLFSISSGMQMTAVSIGQWVGGFLPAFFAAKFAISAMVTQAYSMSLWAVAFGALLAVVPMLMVTRSLSKNANRSSFAPLTFIRKNPGMFGKLIMPTLVTSIGAGLIMPFMNVFFRTVHHQSDGAIGTAFAWGSLAMGVGLLIAPALAERFGKIQVVVISQALSVPFLIALGFSPVYGVVLVAYYARTMLMNMSSPIYSTYVMERVEPESRGMLASLTSMASNFGWALSPTISGYLQVKWGFGPPFILTILLYSVSIAMYYLWFWRPDLKKKAQLRE